MEHRQLAFRIVSVLVMLSLVTLAGTSIQAGPGDDVLPNAPPTADPNGPYTGDEGSPVTFDGTDSYDPDGDPLIYDWDFGDASPIAYDAGPSPSHTYDDNGEYTVCLTVTDPGGLSDRQCTTWTTLALMPATSGGPAVAFEDGKLYVIGGASWTEVEAYDPATDTWTAGTLTPMPTARYAAGVAATGGKIYVIGGSVAFNEPDYKDVNEAYDPATDTWAARAPMPGLHRAYSQAVTAPDGKIYVIGGRLFASCFQCPVYTVQAYDPTTDAWADKAPMPIPRQLFAAAELDGKIYAAGGCTKKGCADSRTDRVDVYDPATDTWSPVAPLLEARDSLALVAMGGRLYTLGGYSSAGGPLVAVDEYDPNTNTWAPVSQVPTPRNLSVAAVGATIFTFGNTTVEAMNWSSVTISNVAPTVSIDGVSPALVAVGEPVEAIGNFTDPSILDTHTAVWDWEGSPSPGAVNETNGSGSVSGNHTYTAAGAYTIKLTVTDKDGGSGEAMFHYVVVYDPSAGFVTGGGWINSPEGAYKPDPLLTGQANFGFVSKYQKGATVPTGNTEFQFHAASLNFHSSSYQWLVVTGSDYARFKGSGTVNGTGDYKFMLWAGDKSPDTFRIKIWIEDALGNETVVYDNGFDQAIGGGDIVVHAN